jgi:glucose-1-phosphate thymidylyltransferase
MIGEKFIGHDACAMILGDNIFYGNGFRKMLVEARIAAEAGQSSIFAYYVQDPQRFGIVEFDQDKKVLSIEEKPSQPKSNYCVTGLYFYDNHVVRLAKQVIPSKRGEFEITDLNNLYLQQQNLNVNILGRGFAWLDTGTFESLNEASNFVKMIEDRQGVKISAPEEIAYLNKWINQDQLLASATRYGKSPYGDHLRIIAKGEIFQ